MVGWLPPGGHQIAASGSSIATPNARVADAFSTIPLNVTTVLTNLGAAFPAPVIEAKFDTRSANVRVADAFSDAAPDGVMPSDVTSSPPQERMLQAHASLEVAPPKNEAVIKLTAISDCWVGLNSPTGKSLYQGVVPAGQSMTWTEKNSVSMVIGNPPGAQLTVNGKSQRMNPTGVVTLSINPRSNTLVTAG